MKVYYSPAQGKLRISTGKSNGPFFNSTRKFGAFVHHHPEHREAALAQARAIYQRLLTKRAPTQILMNILNQIRDTTKET